MPWNPESSIGKHETQLVRALYALPLLFIFYGAGQKMGRRTENFLLPLVKASQIGNLLWILGRWHRSAGDSLGSRVLMTSSQFTSDSSLHPSEDSALLAECRRLHSLEILSRPKPSRWLRVLDAVTSQLQLIYCKLKHLLECYSLTLNRPTALGVLYQLKGICYIAPIYYFLHSVQSPLENYHGADNRLT
jgi:hypothetical protein